MQQRTHVRCGRLFTGLHDHAPAQHTVIVENARVAWTGPTAAAASMSASDIELDYRAHFVMPGMIDNHAHLSYGNALTQEDIDLYASMEFRSLRAMAAAQATLGAGFTSVLDPACAGLVTPAVRDAVNSGLFPGPRITASGRALTSQQGLYDWYPTWVGVPGTSTGVMASSLPQAIDVIRTQAKDGVDAIKLTMDGIYSRQRGDLVAGYTQQETSAMVEEIHRLGKLALVHARGREGALYAARAGVDVIYHASAIDDEGIAAALSNGCHLCPSLTLLLNNLEFHQPTDPSASWWPPIQAREMEQASRNLRRAHAAGVPFIMGSEAGFAVTPCGEWNAKELEAHVRFIGFTPAQALRCATVASAKFLREAADLGGLAPGKLADMVVVNGDPLADITTLQRAEAIHAVLLGGRPVSPAPSNWRARHASEFSQGMWNRLYDRDTVRSQGVRRFAVEETE